jgi:hypothetical protein
MPQTMRALRLLKLPQTSNVKNLQMGSSNACENGHQWTQNVQKPLAGLLQHLIWSKTHQVMLAAIFPFFKLCYRLAICTCGK